MPETTQMQQATQEKVRQFISRIERIEAEKAELATDVREIYTEAKSFGLDTKALRKTIAARKMEADERAEQEAIVGMYLEAAEG